LLLSQLTAVGHGKNAAQQRNGVGAALLLGEVSDS